MKSICKCGAGFIGKNGLVCRKCHEEKKKNETAKSVCKLCGGESIVKRYKALWYLKNGYTCRSCRSEISSSCMKNTLNNMTKKERIENGRKANKLRKNISQSIFKQWESIKSNKDGFNKLVEKRSRTSKKTWDEMSEEKRDERIKSLFQSHGKKRSKISDRLKEEMIKNGIYDGFVSEEIFHGFIPDEINHNLKIIIEMFGDHYHCNPKKYTDPMRYVSLINRKVFEQWKRDQIRIACFWKHGYKTFVVWESDFIKSSDNEIEKIKFGISDWAKRKFEGNG